MQRMGMGLVLVAVVASAAHADSATDRAKAFVQAQVDACAKDDTAAVKATFAADAVLLGTTDGADAVGKIEDSFRGRLMDGSPHSQLGKIVIKSLVADGDDQKLWLTAELAVSWTQHETGVKASKQTMVSRLTELLVADGKGWKAVAAVLDQPTGKESPGHPDAKEVAIGNATKSGSLAALAATPAQLAAAFGASKSVFVLGTAPNERAVGAAAVKKLLGKWTKLGMTLGAPVREVETATYGFAEVSVTYTHPDKFNKGAKLYVPMYALVIAVPNGTGWSVVGVHYSFYID